MPFTTVHVTNDQITKIWCSSLKIDADGDRKQETNYFFANTLSDFTVEIKFCAFTNKYNLLADYCKTSKL